jgi:hypothetical protein
VRIVNAQANFLLAALMNFTFASRIARPVAPGPYSYIHFRVVLIIESNAVVQPLQKI